MNGHTDGLFKKPQMSAFADAKAQQQKPSSSKSPLGAIFSVATRLLLWYTVITALFRCPSSIVDLTGESPQICKPYFQLRSQAAPYVQPYYDAYLKSYVDRAQPHVDNLNQKFVTPAAVFAKQQYDVYGAPKVAQLQNHAEGTWSSTIKPRLETRREWARSQYDQQLAPYVDHARTLTDPYVSEAYHELTDIYDTAVIPLYRRALPYLHGAYQQGHYVITEIVFPTVQTAQHMIFEFLRRTLWPQMIILYGENVEPQLTKITERLGRYKDGRKLQAAVKGVDYSSSMVSKTARVSSSITSAASVAGSIKTESPTPSAISKAIPTPEPAASPQGSPSPDKPSSPVRSPSHEPQVEEEKDTREKIESDLRNWQEKFAVAADKGATDLKLRVTEITSRQMENQAQGVGQALVTQLEETSHAAMDALKGHIVSAVKALPEDADEKTEKTAYEALVTEVRNAGTAIKEKAQAIRNWKSGYDQDTSALVNAALESTLKIIDNIRDLGLQQIGMRWANMEGVTYEDWSAYHDLKSEFDGWRKGVEDAALLHEGLTAAKEEGAHVQDIGMKDAQKTVSELVRLRDVGKWKIAARDSSDDFSTRTTPPKGNKPKPKPQTFDGASEEELLNDIVIVPESFESIAMESSSKTTAVDPAAAQTDEATSTAPLSEASSSVQSVSSAIADQASIASNKVFGGAMAAHVDEKHIVYDNAYGDDESVLDKIQSAVSDAMKLTPTVTQDTVESMTSAAGAKYEQAMSVASAALFGTTPGVVESASSVAADKYSQAVTAASYAIYGTPKPVLESIASQASAQYDQAVSLAKEQYSKGSVAMVGTPKPAYEAALSSIESAYSDSLAAASSNLDSIMGYTASVTKLWAAPTQGTFESLSSAASVRLQQGLNQASAQYESAKIAVGAQPAPVHQQYLAEAQKQYYQGLGLAHDQYSKFLTAASTAVYGTPTPAYESALSAAQTQYSGALAAAKSKYDEVLSAANSAIGNTKKTPAQTVLDSASSQYEAAKLQAAEALSAASASASSLIYGTSTGNAEYLASAASEQILGKETPWTEAAASQASENWEALISKASAQIYGTPAPWHEDAYSQVGDYAAQATDAAAAQYAALLGIVNELVVGKEPDFTESVAARLSSAYYTGMPNYASSASSAASVMYASAASVVTSVFTPPPTLEAILQQASDQLDSAVAAASEQIYGTQAGVYEQATSAAGSAYNAGGSKVSEAVYGTQPSYLESAQAGFADIGANAQKAISEAIYGTPTGTIEAGASSAADVYSSVSSVVGENVAAAGDAVKDTYSAASAKVSEAIYGPELSALESAQGRVAEALASARSKLEELTAQATGAAAEGVAAAKSSVEAYASVVSAKAQSVKDEL